MTTPRNTAQGSRSQNTMRIRMAYSEITQQVEEQIARLLDIQTLADEDQSELLDSLEATRDLLVIRCADMPNLTNAMREALGDLMGDLRNRISKTREGTGREGLVGLYRDAVKEYGDKFGQIPDQHQVDLILPQVPEADDDGDVNGFLRIAQPRTTRAPGRPRGGLTTVGHAIQRARDAARAAIDKSKEEKAGE